MKVRSIGPGSVWLDETTIAPHYRYTITINGVFVHSRGSYDSANAAKQAMREEVAFLRRKHGLGK